MINEFLPSYTSWIFHGENLSSPVPHNVNVRQTDLNDGDETYEMLYEGFGLPPPSFIHEAASSGIKQGPDEKTKKFFNLLKEAERELYPEFQKFSTLSFIVQLLHIKCLSGWSEKSFTMLLELLKDSFPKGETLPKLFYATRKLLRDLGLDYHKVHACPRDCSLYWKETAGMDDCIVCHMPRYKQFEEEENDVKKQQQRIPHKIFGSEPRNVRLGLAADGFNPFKAMNVSHSSWPVIIMPYNLPPWLCMKQPHMMMTLLINGPFSPGNNIDVYLRLVVDELKELWENSVDTYDAETNQMFRMHAVLLWTINDFPAYLSGANVLQQLGPKFKLNSKRKQSSKRNRNGKEKEENEDSGHNWKKKSIFFELSYWEHNLIRHNLDVMHIEKNVCDNVLWTILNVDGKGKDNLNTRRDLQDMGIRKALHPQKRVGNKYYLPPACFAMNNREKSLFCTLLKNIKVPDGYASNISRRVNLKQRSISGLKSHDNHILMKQILPIAVRNLLPKKVVELLIELSNFFRQLCFKTLEVDGLNCLQSQIALTLCHLERIFPPSFFDIMEHLPIHLAEEAKIAGPVQYRWMHFIERYLMTLKSYMRNRSHPEGSIAQGYLVEECPSSSQATQKQTRGPTYVHGQWGTSEDGILKVVPNELNQVVEGHTSPVSHLGVLARDGSLAPLTFMTWHYVPKQNKDNIWREIKAHTDADESMKRTIMASFGKKWRDWKSRVKTMGYKPVKNDAERLAHRPDRVHEDQWWALVYY
ncbi:uncharacterized protein LOC114274092 [Camellia sinensis]|uniref:uncharacterized protein LOC114274092 n=1 Tax=Camellia sinensis TaxID=4442 RepID=UPI001035A00B|nr:uncharacterized protein LOC114274092 [Camellia sinensis]